MNSAKKTGRLAHARGFLARLASNKSGNSLAIMTASMIPLAGIMGGGLDAGRAYLSKSRLQAACDAGALAGRKTLTGTTWTAAAEDAAKSYFDVNFLDGQYGTTDLTKSFTSADGQAVTGQATAKVPTTLMKVFGKDYVALTVTCEAVMNLPNTDIMFVLDTTGSMNDVNPGDTASRMIGMRSAVRNFYDQVEAAKGSSASQIRYGFVPYAQTVNVGAELKPEWIADEWKYQSRKPDGTSNYTYAGGDLTTAYNYKDYTYPGTSYPSPTATNHPLEACASPSSTYTYSTNLLWEVSTPYSGPPVGDKWDRRYRQVYSGIYYSLNRTSTSCTVYAYDFNGYIQEFTQESWPAYTSASSGTNYLWEYDQIKYDTSSLTVGGSITANTGSNHTPYTSVWNGCIEERQTELDSDYDPIPNKAYDLQIDKVPDGDPDTQWGPYMPGLIWARDYIWSWNRNKHSGWGENWQHYGSGYSYLTNCPSPARKLSAISSSDLTTYLGGLVPSGNTHHDIGMVWGARFLSPTGLFASENATAPNGNDITRHIIFMTDGETHTLIQDYDAYGLNALDRRRKSNPNDLPTDAENDDEVELRFGAVCQDIKERQITIWVIAFGTDLSSMLENCANTSGHAFEASDTSELNEAFAAIAGQISNLRIKD